MRDIDAVSGDVIEVALRIHRELGPGLLESVYEVVLAGMLIDMGYKVDRQKPIDIEFEGRSFSAAFRIDLLVDDRLIVEIKCVEHLLRVHEAQASPHPKPKSNSPPRLPVSLFPPRLMAPPSRRHLHRRSAARADRRRRVRSWRGPSGG